MRDELRKLAEAATPGPWHPGHLGRKDHPCKCTSIVDEGYAGGIARVNVWNGIKSISDGGNDAPPEEEAAANMNFIAAANPTAVIALLDEITALRAKVKRQAEALRPFAEFAFAPLIPDEAKFALVECVTSGPYADLVPTVTAGDLRRAAQEASDE